MPSTASRIDIYNMTLDLLEEAPVTSVTDGKPATNWLNRNYPTARDGELRKHSWNFALTRASLAADAAAPAVRLGRAVHTAGRLPGGEAADRRRQAERRPVPYEVEANKVLTDAVAPVQAALRQAGSDEEASSIRCSSRCWSPSSPSRWATG